MVEINSNDYHNFVIKDGKLVAEFEQMYKKSKEIPWHQNEMENWLDIKTTIQILNGCGCFEYFFDFGCGLGHFLDIIKKHLGSENCKALGYDISQTCCKKAKDGFSGSRFNEI